MDQLTHFRTWTPCHPLLDQTMMETNSVGEIQNQAEPQKYDPSEQRPT